MTGLVPGGPRYIDFRASGGALFLARRSRNEFDHCSGHIESSVGKSVEADEVQKACAVNSGPPTALFVLKFAGDLDRTQRPARWARVSRLGRVRSRPKRPFNRLHIAFYTLDEVS